MLKYIFTISLLLVSATFVFADFEDDTICRSAGAQIEEGIVFIDSSQRNFVRCFKGHVLQPVGGDMVYEDEVAVKKEEIPNILGLESLGRSSEYGDVYSLPDGKLANVDYGFTAQTASVTPAESEQTSTESYLIWGLLFVLVLLGGVTLVGRRKQE